MPSLRQQIVNKIATKIDRDDFMEVAGATNLGQLSQTKKVEAGCYVVLINEHAPDAEYAQLVTEHYGIVIICRNIAPDHGDDGMDEIERLRRKVYQAISNYAPSNAEIEASNLKRVGGKLVDFENGYITWQDVYSLNYTRSTEPN